MYDVKFGDCFSLEEDGSYFVVDCGSKNSDSYMTRETFPFSKIQPLLKFNPALLITHFDYDHYSGILAMSDNNGCVTKNKYKSCLKEIYLPYCFWLDGNVITGYKESIDQTGLIHTMIYLTLLTRFKKLINLSRLFASIPSLVLNHKNVHCVEAGETIDFKGHPFNVLWPSQNAVQMLSTDRIANVNKVLREKLKKQIGTQETKIERNYEETIESFAASLQEIYKYYAAIEKNSDTFNGVLGRFNEAFTKFINLSESITKIAVKGSPAILKGEESVIDGMNACSIIFDEKSEGNRIGKVLFLGDATPKVIHQIDNKFANSYVVIKVQHHATNPYFCCLHKAKYNLISNNGYPNWPISNRQVQQIQGNGGSILYTSSHNYGCINGKCNSSNCNPSSFTINV